MSKILVHNLFFLSILACPFIAHSQDSVCAIDQKKNEYYIGTSKITNITLELTNICSEDVYIWIDKDSIDNIEYNNLILNYFFKTKGDFSFIQLMGENMSTNLPTEIYLSFIKMLKRDDKFFINVIYEGDVENISICTSYIKKRVVAVKRSLLAKYFDPQILNDYLYKSNNLILLSKYLSLSSVKAVKNKE